MNLLFSDYKITEFNPQQSDALFALIDANRPRLEDFFPGTVARTRSLADTISYCKEMSTMIAEQSYFPFVILRQSDEQMIGWIDVKNIDWRIPKAEVGYFVDQQFAGRGITSRAIDLLVDQVVKKYGFKKLLCRAAAENIGSCQVALKNGFQLEGQIRRDFKKADGTLVDLNYYGRLF